ncbi:hypothetical protein JCM14469_13890 [Desulfatiferula olefinivorans]
MEDSSRDLEKELKKYAMPNPFKRSGRWQLLFVSDDGRMVTIRRYRQLALTLVLVLGLSLSAAVLFSLLYINTLDANRSLTTALYSAEKERRTLQQDKEHLQAQLFIPKKKLDTASSAPAAEKKAEEPPPAPVKKAVKKEDPMRTEIKDLTVTKDEADNETRVRFIVKNVSELKSISGRVFVILKPESDRVEDWLTMPPVALKDGNPATPSRGQFFSINHFKSVNFKFTNHFPDDHYKRMTVFVFSTDGNKVYEHTFDVDLVVIRKPVPVEPPQPVNKPADMDSVEPADTAAAEENTGAVSVEPADVGQGDSADED